MFGLKKGPTRPFSHADNCKILKADPGVEIKWSEVETGHWRAVCQCGSDDVYEEANRRVRLDPLDPKTSHHAPECEYAASDAAVLKIVLKIKEGAGGTYWWVACGVRYRLAGSALRRERRVTTKPLSCAALSGLVAASLRARRNSAFQLDLLATLVLPTALVRSPHLTRHGGSEELGV
jgi:hypothetical protein